MATGAHGLPLMGGGDWNDGMNLVGIGGKGESVWLAWFLISILGPLRRSGRSARGDRDLATTYRRHAVRLTAAAEQAWDGAWYRRAYFDDGTPLGSAANAECRIDAIAQSWAVIAGTGDPERARRAMESTDEHLVRRAERLVLLADAAVRQDRAESGLHPGLRARRARERRPVHARRALDRPGVCAAWRRRSRDGAVRADQPGEPRTHAGGRRSSIAPNRTSWRPTSTRAPLTPAAAAGRGTRDRPAGSTVSDSRRSSG